MSRARTGGAETGVYGLEVSLRGLPRVGDGRFARTVVEGSAGVCTRYRLWADGCNVEGGLLRGRRVDCKAERG